MLLLCVVLWIAQGSQRRLFAELRTSAENRLHVGGASVDESVMVYEALDEIFLATRVSEAARLELCFKLGHLLGFVGISSAAEEDR